MVTAVQHIEPPRDIYVNFARRSDQFLQRGRLLCRDVQVFVANQYNLLKRHDKELFPIALVAASVCMLFASNILLLVGSFAAGALFRVAKGEAWKEGMVNLAKEAWQGSHLGKIAVAAFLILFAAPMKWNIAAFGLGIYVVHVLQQQQPATPTPSQAQPPAAPPAQAAAPQPVPRVPAPIPPAPVPAVAQPAALPQGLVVTPALLAQIGAIVQGLQQQPVV